MVSREWIAVRCIGTGVLHGDYVDVGHHETIAELRTALAPHAVHHGVHDIDAAALRLSAPRAFTQEISRYVFGQSTGGGREWNGLAYRSRHGDDLQNWATFEPASPLGQAVTTFQNDDPDLVGALELHDLVLV